MQNLLDESTSRTISKDIFNSPNSKKEIAIKLFKGELTSDGPPTDKMKACIAAGQHPNLINPIGQIKDHPGKQGLVLELIPPHYTNLGLPPTLDSCTRDSFHAETAFAISHCKRILLGIAGASEHLHDRGISHGDLYAHNILIDKSGHALLGDFGATTIHGKDHVEKQAIEKMEVLAFGHLVEDLLGLIEREIGDEGSILSEKDVMVIESLNLLHYQCSNPTVRERPSFGEIREVLEGL